MNHNYPPITEVRRCVTAALTEDLAPMGDITSSLIDPLTKSVSEFRARERGRLAGRACVEETFCQVDPTTTLTWHLDDGDVLEPGAVICRASGTLTTMLIAERTALNFVSHLSGIATLTATYVKAAGGNCRILDTRKTTPGLRALEKAAVRSGGGHNHRGSLSEFVLVKDNHLTGMSIAEAISAARERWPARTIEVECDRVDQVQEAVRAGADMVLLDNMTPDVVARIVESVRGSGSRTLLDVSGGVDLTTVADYAAARPDFISIGALTHSAPVLDIGLDIGT
jgi:nicotinate-nucleotide pyrophosphorylase (carboxylating)